MKKSIVLCILAAVSFGITPTFLDLTIRSGFSQETCVLYYNLFLVMMCGIWCAVRHCSLKIPFRQVMPLLLMGATGMGATVVLLAHSYTYIPVGTATVLQFLYPSIVTVACAVLLHRPLRANSYLSIVLSIVGLLFISVFGSKEITIRPIGLLLALA